MYYKNVCKSLKKNISIENLKTLKYEFYAAITYLH